MFPLIYALKKHNNWRFSTPSQPRISFERAIDTLADSYVLKTSKVSGFAAEMACKRKHSKYSSIISSNYIFKGLAFETLGPWCKEAIDFIIGNRLIAESDDSKSKKLPFNVETLQAFGALFQIPHYYRKFLYCKTKMLCTHVIKIVYYFKLYFVIV
jgi:hypothetical protein